MGHSIRCHAMPGPALGRRSALLALPGLALAPALSAAWAAPSGPGLAELVAADGSASSLARSLAGTQVRLLGYLAPSLDGREFALTEGPAAPCQLCGNLHDTGTGVAVRLGEPDLGAPVFERVQVSGRLEVDGGVRLVSARIQAA